MSRIPAWALCLGLVWLPASGLMASQVQLARGNAIWIKPSSTTIPGNEAALVAGLNARAIKHIFLWTVAYKSTDYVTFTPFIQQAHAGGLTVHAICATKTTVSSGSQLSSALLSNYLAEVFIYNTNHPTAAFDGVQIDVEGVTGTNLFNLVAGVHVPDTLVFSADVQPEESYGTIESAYGPLLQNTDMDLLIPMLYSMDGIVYSGGSPGFMFPLSKIQTKTAHDLLLLPSTGRLMTGLSCYDCEYAISKSTGGIDWDYLTSINAPGGFTQPAFSTTAGSRYTVPNLVSSNTPLVDVFYLTNTGVSQYRFDWDSSRWMEVLEMSPIGLRRAIAAADQAGSGDGRYLGTCTWLYNTVFDPYVGRQEGLTPDDGVYPNPVVSLQVISVQGGLARVRVSLTNAAVGEHIVGAHAAAGVHLQLEGAYFVSADRGTFHAAEAFEASGSLRSTIEGAQVLELRRSFFENSASPRAQSGEVAISCPAWFTLRYRAWMMDKDSICNDVGTSEPYIARSPDDVHYSAPAKFLTYATFATNIVVFQPASYASAVLSDRPITYHRFAETNVVSLPAPLIVSNLGTVGLAGDGAPVATNGFFSASIVGGQPGCLAAPATNTALTFPGIADSNRITMPFLPEWNWSGPFSVELWLKGGTNFSCPVASVEYNKRGWLIYQGDAGPTTGDGWWFRLHKTGEVRVNAQVNMTVNPNLWYHIVGVYDGTYARLYVNGAQADAEVVGGTYTPNTNTAYPLTFGGRPPAGAYPFGGVMDEAAFYTNALSASQIAAHYAAATTNPVAYSAQILAHNPAGYWRFDEKINPPKAANSGSLGATADGVYLNWSTTIPDLQAPTWPGLETTNRVLELFGTNGQVLIPPLNLNTNALTFECLLKRSGSQQNYAGLIMHRNPDGGGASACGLGFRGTYSHLGYNWNDAANTYTWDSGVTPPDGQWAYVALTVSPSQAIICLCDGTVWSTATHMASHAIQAFAGLTRIGTDGGTNRWFNGLIDEAAIYNATLSQTQLRIHALAAFGNTNQPLFTQVPASQTVELGTPVSFSAATVGPPTMLYQWQKDAVALDGATNATLPLTSVDYTNAGQYRVSANNGYGNVLSPAATLTVLPPASVTNLTFRSSTTPAGPRLELIWPSGDLYSADQVTGPWVLVPDATPPYYLVPFSPAAASKFYCVQ